MGTLQKMLSIYNTNILCKLYTKKKKYIDYENLPPNCINNGNYFNLINKYSTNLLTENIVLSIYFWSNLILKLKNARLRSLFNSQLMKNII